MFLYLRIFIFIGLACVAVRGRAQVTDSEESAQWLASNIVASGGGTVDQYMDYSRRLAKTLAMLPASKQAEILGTTPPSGGSTGTGANGGNSSTGAGGSDTGGSDTGGSNTGGSDTGGTGGSGNDSSYTNPAEAIADPDITSDDLFDYLLNSIPLSETDLTGALERDPPLGGAQLSDLLIAQGGLSNGFLVSSLSNSKDNLSSENLKDILIANSPVKSVVLKKMATTTKMTDADKAAVLAAQ